MINYFKECSAKDFKISKEFWSFYSSFIKLKSTKESTSSLTINNGTTSSNDPSVISNMFNTFFTTLSSNSTSSIPECKEFIKSHFNSSMNINNLNKFKFEPTTNEFIGDLLFNLSSSSGAGATGISSKILKSASLKLVPIITKLFNEFISSGFIPDDLKKAVVTPIFKNKGSVTDINNYRGISVLPPIAKLLEKVLSTQIIDYFNKHKLLFKGQHGFRENHSCESALHEIISEMNFIRSIRSIGLYLFIDFRKAFDLINTTLLLYKLELYGFDTNAINLISNYFSNRSQKVKYDGKYSSELLLILGLGQGSCLAPLLFLIFINDLPSFLRTLKCKLFADDTTISSINSNLDDLLINFNTSINSLTEWCSFNTMDINWDKTLAMFITNKHITTPNSIMIGNIEVKVVSDFRLLGVTIDNKMNFLKYVGDLRLSINRKLFAIKRLFFLSNDVKLQFFKTFILPYFDYCSSIFIYFTKSAIQKLSNTYNLCLFKLFKFKWDVKVSNDYNELNSNLEQVNLANFQHRILKNLILFSYKMVNYDNSPETLKNSLKLNSEYEKRYDLRSKNKMNVPKISILNQYGSETFSYSFSKLINLVCIDDLCLDLKFFKLRTKNNINLNFDKFIATFKKFDLNYNLYTGNTQTKIFT